MQLQDPRKIYVALATAKQRNAKVEELKTPLVQQRLWIHFECLELDTEAAIFKSAN
jgi:hypothetical protein